MKYVFILCPAVIGTLTYLKLMNLDEKFNLKLLTNYLINLLFTNMIVITIFVKLMNKNISVDYSLQNYPGYSVKYAFLSVLVSLFLSLIFSIINKNIKISLEVKKNDKKK